MSCALIRFKLSCLVLMFFLCGAPSTLKHGGGSIMLYFCFAAGETGSLLKLDGTIRKEDYVDILKQNVKPRS